MILEELKMESDNPEYLVHETFSCNFWKDHALGKPVLGTKETIRGFNRDMVAGYYRDVYTPSNFIITAAGNLEHVRMVELVEKWFGGLVPVPNRGDGEQPKTHARVVVRDKRALEQIQLMIGVPAYPVAHERRFAAYVLNTLLGGSMSSRLFQNIREQRGLVYAVFSDFNAYRDSGVLAVYAGTSRQSIRQVVRLVLDEFRRLKDMPLPEDELRRSKSHLKGSVMLGLESTSSRMQNLARQQLYFGRFATMDEVLESIEAVTADEVQQVAREFFRPEGVALTVLGRLNGMKIRREELEC